MSPLTETIVPPELAVLTVSRYETTGASHEKTASLVPTTALTVTACDCFTPYAPNLGEDEGISHITDVPDVHTDVPHCPMAATLVGVESLAPKLNPSIESVTPEQVGRFAELPLLIVGASNVNFRIAVPTTAWIVTIGTMPVFLEP